MEKKTVFSLSILFFWIKGSVTVDTKFVKVSKRNTLLGIIPAGEDRQTIPLKNISSATISFRYKISLIFLGAVVLFLSGQVIKNNFFLFLILFLVGINILGSGFQNILTIQKSGNNYFITVPFYEKSKLSIIQKNITQALIQDTNKTDLNLFFNKKEDKI